MGRKEQGVAGSDDIVTQMLWRQVLARVQAQAGRADEAERLAREAIEFGDRTDMLVNRAAAHLDLAEVLRLRADVTRRLPSARTGSISSSGRATCRWPPGHVQSSKTSTRLRAMRVLVTGGAGFIGSNFVRHAARAPRPTTPRSRSSTS